MKMKRFIFVLILLAFTLAACGPRGPLTLTVMTHDSFAASDAVIAVFEKANNAKVVFLKSGDAGAALNKAILTRNAPLADVFYGVDNTFLSRALQADIYLPYTSPLMDQIPDAFHLDPGGRVAPVDYGDVCINYDKTYFASNNLSVPAALEDLVLPRYKDMLVVENPATSSTGLAFLLATIKHFGSQAYLDYWKSLRANGLVVVDSWETAYYTNFSGSSGHGPQPLVVSYATSPAAEVFLAKPMPKDSPIGTILGPDTCFRQVEFVGILRGARQPDLARKFVDFMLSRQFQEDMPLQMYVYPVNRDAKLPDIFVKYAQVASQPASLDPAAIAAGRDQWVQFWTMTVLH